MVRKRYHPCFLSDGEAARDRRRLEDMVRSITGVKQTEAIRQAEHAASINKWRISERIAEEETGRSSIKTKTPATTVGLRGTVKVGETGCFKVYFDLEKRVAIIHGREIPYGSPFRLRLNLTQAAGVLVLLERAKDMVWGSESRRIGKLCGHVVDYDGNLLMLYEEIPSEYPLKLAFDKTETVRMIELLKKVYWAPVNN